MISAAFNDRRVRGVAIALVVLKLWFVTAQPMVVISGARLDDRLFFEMANRILKWEWLGEYDQFTLPKGVGYPLFIVASMFAGLPLPMAEHLFYLFACWMIVRALRPVLHHDIWALVLFVGLAWQPMSYTMPLPIGGTGSVLRQNIVTPLALLIFASLIALHTRRGARPLVLAGWALLGGVAMGWFWITREENIWIVPSAVLLVVVSVVLHLRAGGEWARGLWPYGTTFVVAWIPVAIVSGLNRAHYGWFGACEFHARAFASAYSALVRVRVGAPIAYVPVSNETRRAIYEACPTFAQLRPAIEGDIGRRYRGGPTHEFNGGMWVWALRDSVAETIRPRDARAALEFYQRLADEVNAACDTGKLSAGPRRRSFMPPWQPANTQALRASLLPYASYFVLFRDFKARPIDSHSHGAPDLLLLFRDLAQWPISPTADVPPPAAPRTRKLRAWRIAALDDIGQFMRGLIVASLAIGALSWIYALAVAIRRRVGPDFLWWVATTALGGAGAIFVVSLLVHVTSWEDWRPVRFLSGYPLLVLFACTAVIDAVARMPWRRWRGGAREGPPGQ
jgi:hypothetical protein